MGPALNQRAGPMDQEKREANMMRLQPHLVTQIVLRGTKLSFKEVYSSASHMSRGLADHFGKLADLPGALQLLRGRKSPCPQWPTGAHNCLLAY